VAHFVPSPKFTGGVVNPIATPQPSALGGVAWFAAPSTSHIFGWKYFDIRLFPNQPTGVLGQVSILLVRFRDKNGGASNAQYAYAMPDPDFGQRISDEMEQSAHPYGSVLYPKVIKAGFAYTRT
jgi:hypothetical protein